MQPTTTTRLANLVKRDGAEAVAERIGVDPTTLARWLAGMSQPREVALRAIESVLADAAKGAAK